MPIFFIIMDTSIGKINIAIYKKGWYIAAE